MKRISFSLASVLLLAACSTQQTVTYRLDFNVTDKTVQQSLATTSMEVVERRLGHLGVQLIKKETTTKDDQTFLTVTLPDKQSADALTGELTAPFDLKVMKEAEAGQPFDVTIENHGSFADTGINQKDFEWVEAHRDELTGKGAVGLTLTPEGKTKIQTLFKTMKGKSIGIFVRGKLVSLLKIQTDEAPDNLIIRDVPSADIAQIFADDMDVGLHVTFTPVP